jgi:biopolymer transport protein ExbD
MFKPPEPANLDLNLAPMVDVMMCLIIFFLLASKLVQAENYELELPWAVCCSGGGEN